MVGRHRGFIVLLERVAPDILTVHCVIDRQHLVEKNLSDRLHQSLQYAISAVNKIHSKFRRLLLYTEIHWLFKSFCHNRYWNLVDTVLEFLKNRNVALRDRLLEFMKDFG
nr:uncharacterized protein LOC122274088 [Parasteatoda tepidariorum]